MGTYINKTKKIKRTIDLEECISKRLDEIKEKDKKSYCEIVNDILNKTVCIDPDTKCRVVKILRKEAQALLEETRNCNMEDKLWVNQCYRQRDALEELVRILEM